MSFARSALLTMSVALVVSVTAGRPVWAAGDNVVSYSAPVVVTDPCTGEVGTGTLDVLIVVNQTATSGGTVHVTAHASVHGDLTGNRGSIYHVSAEGTAHASSLGNLYDVPFHGQAVGDGNAPDVAVDGVAGVHVNSTGDPIGAGLISFSASCGH